MVIGKKKTKMIKKLILNHIFLLTSTCFRLKNGPANLQDLVSDLNTKKRKRRTSFTPQALEKLNDAFELNTHPSGTDMSTLAQELNYDREVIRVWYEFMSYLFTNIIIYLSFF